MRLSDVKGARTLDVIADLIDPVTAIASDEAAAELFRRKKVPEGMTSRAFTLERAKKCIPALLKGHKGDIIAILAAIEGVEPGEYEAALNLAKLTKDCIDLLTDETFSALFISAQSGETSSGSARESTGEAKA